MSISSSFILQGRNTVRFVMHNGARIVLLLLNDEKFGVCAGSCAGWQAAWQVGGKTNPSGASTSRCMYECMYEV